MDFYSKMLSDVLYYEERERRQDEWHTVLITWETEFENFCKKADQLNEDWSKVTFNISMLTDDEKKLMEDYKPDMSWVDTAYDFRREIQKQIECMFGYDYESKWERNSDQYDEMVLREVQREIETE